LRGVRKEKEADMKIFHVSDTHLGFSAFAKLDPERGLNQREADFYDSFERFVELAVKERPNLILHTGDLFDSVRPSNRAISFALSEIRKLADAGIRFIAISGNHETPRLRETGSVFRIMQQLSDCEFVYEEGFKRIEADGIEVMAIPHSTDEQFKKSLKEIKALKKEMPRVVLMHTGLLGVEVFRMNEVNELLLDRADIELDADYVALGHYHNYYRIDNNCFYAGSTERLSIAEAGHEKGFLSIDFESGKKKFVQLKTRAMIDFPDLNLNGESAGGATSAILRTLESKDFQGSIARMKITGLSRDTKMGLDLNRIRKVIQKALSFDIKLSEKEDEQLMTVSNARIGGLAQEFGSFLARTDSGKLDKKRLEREALELFAEREE
jgi:exonuclease SbcD